MKSVAFFSNVGGVGKTFLIYHLAWMFADRGIATLAVDLDPRANLTAMFLDEARLESLWLGDDRPDTVFGSVRPILRGTGDINMPHVEQITEKLGLIPGDLGLSRFADILSDAWARCHIGRESAFRTVTSFHRLIQKGAEDESSLVLIDVGSDLGTMSRTALTASDFVCIPLAPDLFSLQGLKSLGPALREWRSAWKDLSTKAPPDLWLPKGTMHPLGYIVVLHGLGYGRPVQAYRRWMDRIPNVYRETVLEEAPECDIQVGKDPHCLSLLKHYRSLMPMAMEVRKPIFFLKPADGAIGAHIEAVRTCYFDFQHLASRIAERAGIPFA